MTHRLTFIGRIEKMAKMTRRQAREAAFALVYESSFHREREDYELILAEAEEYSELAGDGFTKSLYLGTMEKMPELDGYISKYSTSWKLERVSRVCGAVLRLAIYEMIFAPEKTPYRVVINEAVELSKKYDDEKAPAFVNGILNKIADDEGLKG